MSNDLNALLSEAEREVATRPDGHLPIAWRRRIWKALGPRAPRSDPRQAPGLARRARLAIAAAEHAFPAWDAEAQGDLPRTILAAARAYLAGGAPFDSAEREWGGYWSSCEGLAEEGLSPGPTLAA